MSDVQDDILHELLQTAEKEAPKWRNLHLNFKHNLLTHRGVDSLLKVILLATELKRLYVNVSYNRMDRAPVWFQPEGLVFDMIGSISFGPRLPPLEKCILKTDNDVFEFAMMRIDLPAWDTLQHLRLSLAFSNPVMCLHGWHTMHNLKTLDLDFEGCRFTNNTFQLLVQWLERSLSKCLQKFSLCLSESNLESGDIQRLFYHGIARLEHLEWFSLSLGGLEIWDATMDIVFHVLPRSLQPNRFL